MRKRFFSIIVCVVMLFTMNVTAFAAETQENYSETAIAIEELSKCGAHTFLRVGTCGGMQENILGGISGDCRRELIRMEGQAHRCTGRDPRAVLDFTVTTARRKSNEKNGGIRHHVGVVQSKDSFFGQHEPQIMPVSYELTQKWQAWLRMGCLASEMESAALFIAGSFLHVRVGACFLVLANQEREKGGLPNVQAHDTTQAIATTVNPFYFTELATHLLYHVSGCSAYGVHGQTAEQECHHTAQKHAA